MSACNGNTTAMVTARTCVIPMIDFSNISNNINLKYGNSIIAKFLVTNSRGSSSLSPNTVPSMVYTRPTVAPTISDGTNYTITNSANPTIKLTWTALNHQMNPSDTGGVEVLKYRIYYKVSNTTRSYGYYNYFAYRNVLSYSY